MLKPHCDKCGAEALEVDTLAVKIPIGEGVIEAEVSLSQIVDDLRKKTPDINICAKCLGAGLRKVLSKRSFAA